MSRLDFGGPPPLHTMTPLATFSHLGSSAKTIFFPFFFSFISLNWAAVQRDSLKKKKKMKKKKRRNQFLLRVSLCWAATQRHFGKRKGARQTHLTKKWGTWSASGREEEVTTFLPHPQRAHTDHMSSGTYCTVWPFFFSPLWPTPLEQTKFAALREKKPRAICEAWKRRAGGDLGFFEPPSS
jgi:hypothetical protein